MMRLIDADALGNRMYHESFEKDSDLQRWDGGCWIRYKLFEQVLRAAPTIDPTPSNTLGALDCVERQAAMKIRFSSGFDHDGILFVPYRDVEKHLKKLPSVQPRKGKWTGHFDGNEWYWYCSSCKEQWYEEDLWMGGNSFPNFCPNCGADMKTQFEEPEINPCRGCEDYDGKGGCKTKGGCADRRGDSE